MADTFTQTTALQFGAATLKAALSAMGLSLSDQAFFWLLGQAYGESGLGLGDMAHMPSAKANFLGTNNWGAVYCGATSPKGSVLKAVPDATCQKGGSDSIPGGAKFVPNVTKYDTPQKGAMGFVGLVTSIPGMAAVLADSSAVTNDYARTLYKAGYFGGCHVGLDGAKSLNQGMSFKANADKLKAQVDADPNVMISCAGKRKGSSLLHDTQAEADEANIKEYASMVDGQANAARKAVGSGPLPALVASGVIPAPQTSSTLSTALKIGFAAGGLGAAGFALSSYFGANKAGPAPTASKKGKKRRA